MVALHIRKMQKQDVWLVPKGPPGSKKTENHPLHAMTINDIGIAGC